MKIKPLYFVEVALHYDEVVMGAMIPCMWCTRNWSQNLVLPKMTTNGMHFFIFW